MVATGKPLMLRSHSVVFSLFYIIWILSCGYAAISSAEKDNNKENINHNLLLGIRFVNYTVKDGRLASGQCCDDPANTTGACPPDLCDVFIEACVTRNTSDPCDVVTDLRTPVIYNNNSLEFGNMIHGRGSNNTMPSLIVRKTDYDGKQNLSISLNLLDFSPNKSGSVIIERIAAFHFAIDWLDSFFNPRPAYRHYFLTTDNAELAVDVISMCNRHYYTDDCSVYCKVTETKSHCLENGTLMCETGWEGPDCLTMTDYCPGNRCQHGSTCVPIIRSYTCTCPPGFTGSFCDNVVPTTTTTTSTTTPTTPATSTATPTTPTTSTTTPTTPTTSTATPTTPTTSTTSPTTPTTSTTSPTTPTTSTTTPSIPTTLILARLTSQKSSTWSTLTPTTATTPNTNRSATSSSDPAKKHPESSKNVGTSDDNYDALVIIGSVCGGVLTLFITFVVVFGIRNIRKKKLATWKYLANRRRSDRVPINTPHDTVDSKSNRFQTDRHPSGNSASEQGIVNCFVNEMWAETVEGQLPDEPSVFRDGIHLQDPEDTPPMKRKSHC